MLSFAVMNHAHKQKRFYDAQLSLSDRKKKNENIPIRAGHIIRPPKTAGR
jgi:hypothetical protein